MRKTLVSALLAAVVALPALAHFPPGELLFAVQFPDENIPVIDGNHADWAAVPQIPYEVGNDKYSDSVYSKARGEIDVSDLSVRQIVGWNDNTDLLYFMAEVFDNVHTRDAEEPNAWWSDDAWEIYVSPSHPEIEGGGGYAPGQEGGILKVGYNWSMPPTAGAWGGYNPPFDWVSIPTTTMLGSSRTRLRAKSSARARIFTRLGSGPLISFPTMATGTLLKRPTSKKARSSPLAGPSATSTLKADPFSKTIKVSGRYRPMAAAARTTTWS